MIEGPTLLREALDAGVELLEAFATSKADEALAQDLESRGVVVRRVTGPVLAQALDTVTPQEIAAIARRVDAGLDVAVEAAASGPLVLVLAGVGDPGNAGTLLRAAEAAGASAVLFCEGSVDPWNPKCVRASAGGLFHVPVTSGGDVVEVIERLRGAGVTSVATVARDGVPYDEADLTGPIALVLGSEAHGLPTSVLSLVAMPVTIPMAGRAESLNVAMAGSVLCFEALRQRRAVR